MLSDHPERKNANSAPTQSKVVALRFKSILLGRLSVCLDMIADVLKLSSPTG